MVILVAATTDGGLLADSWGFCKWLSAIKDAAKRTDKEQELIHNDMGLKLAGFVDNLVKKKNRLVTVIEKLENNRAFVQKLLRE